MRTAWTCLVLLLAASARADSVSDATLRLEDVASLGSELRDFRFLPDGRVIAIRRTGEVSVVTLSPPGSTPAGSFSVDTTGENGLLGVEVDPAFASTGRLFFFYSRSDGAGGTDGNRNVVVSAILSSAGTLDTANAGTLVEGLEGPANPGGVLAIGPDGRLYIGSGDSGCVADNGTPQNFYPTCLSKPNGKVLRVNLDGSIPSGATDPNPLASTTGVPACGSVCTLLPSSSTAPPRKDIWAWGFRHPTGLAFDPLTKRLWMIDSGEGTLEEVNEVSRGKHYGWPYRQGNLGNDTSFCANSTPQSGPCVDPEYLCVSGAAQFGFDGGCSHAVGGAFLDSCTFPMSFRASLYFADRTSGAVFQLRLNPARDAIAANPRTQLATITDGRPTALHLGPDGNLYLSTTAGTLKRLSPSAPQSCAADGGTTDAGTVDGGGGGGGGPTGPPVGGGPPVETGPCGCSAAGGATAGSLLALALALTRRRRR